MKFSHPLQLPLLLFASFLFGLALRGLALNPSFATNQADYLLALSALLLSLSIGLGRRKQPNSPA